MFNVVVHRLTARKLARVALAFILACVAVAALSDVSSAAWRKLPTISRGELEAKCIASGGVYNNNHGGGGYSCASAASGVVSCNSKGQCKGGCPQCPSLVKGGLNGILRPPASAGTASAAGTKNKPTLHNVNQPVVVQHSSGARSGGSKH